MTDLEITLLCAEAMGLHGEMRPAPFADHPIFMVFGNHWYVYDPIHDDAQAMALVKKLELGVSPMAAKRLGWEVICWKEDEAEHRVVSADINRAICECVAKMQKAKT